jgi:hypothetical protein
MIAARPWFGPRQAAGCLRLPWLPADGKLAAPWTRGGDEAIWLSRTSWGMAALADALAEKNGRDVRIWLPEYFCEQALGPMRERCTQFDFYPVDERGRPNWDSFPVDGPQPDLFFLVHFFGHASDHVEARRFCDETGALLVEDATQALGPDTVIGRVGDIVLYSPWKFFAVPNGAVMIIRPGAQQWLAPIRQAVANLGHRLSPGLQWLKQSLRARLWSSASAAPGCEEGDFFIDPHVDDMPQRPKPSPVSKPVLAGVDLKETGRRRRQNDAAIRDFFGDVPGWDPFDPVPAHGPLGSAFRLASPGDADRANSALRRAGLDAGGWPALPPEVANLHSSVGLRLRQTVLIVPCHQELAPKQIVDMLRSSGVR